MSATPTQPTAIQFACHFWQGKLDIDAFEVPDTVGCLVVHLARNTVAGKNELEITDKWHTSHVHTGMRLTPEALDTREEALEFGKWVWDNYEDQTALESDDRDVVVSGAGKAVAARCGKR